jgi:hypothetical protein
LSASTDTNSKSFLLTMDFLSGASDKIQATARGRRGHFHVPLYNSSVIIHHPPHPGGGSVNVIFPCVAAGDPHACCFRRP